MSRHQALDTFGRSGNPVMGNKFDGDAQFRDMPISQKMTLEGTVNKTGILLMLCFVTAAVSWNIPNPILMFTGMGVGLIAAITVSYTHLRAHET